jgi:tRNA dimethylallyltransferase
VSEYVKMAEDCAQDIIGRNKIPVICGGTGLYTDHFMKNTSFSEFANDLNYRSELEKLSNQELYSKLCEIDKKSSDIIHVNNRKRIIRALEIYKITGKTKSETDALSQKQDSKYDFIKLGLRYPDRSLLYDRINKRVDNMIGLGLVREVGDLIGAGLEYHVKKTGAIGYSEIIDYLNNLRGFDETVEKIKQNTRNYAKRQITWFKKDINTVWIDINQDNIKNPGKIIENCLKYVNIIQI